MDVSFSCVWAFGRWIRKAALGDSPVDCRNRRGFSAEKRIHRRMRSKETAFGGFFAWYGYIVSFTTIAKELNGVSRATVESNVKYLESVNLIYQSWPVDMGGRKALKAQQKNYIADAAIRNAVLMNDELLTNPIELGKIVETTVYKHVASFFYPQAARVGHSRGGPKDTEVDIVVDYPTSKKILIEVKHQKKAQISNDDAIIEFTREASVSIIITKRVDDYGSHHTPDGKELIRITTFTFLYLLGNAKKHGYKRQ